jgi:type II secretory pathway pseudopilin PulG
VIRRRSEDGDTLIEVLVALVVLGLASVSLIVAFGTVISASAEHRNLANQNLALEAAAQTVIAALQGDSAVFLCTAPTNYPDWGGFVEPEDDTPYSINYAPTNPVQYWSSTSNTFGSGTGYTCSDGAPQLITLSTIGLGNQTQSLSFVVAQAFTGTGSTGTATQLRIINTPSGSESGTPLAYQLNSNPGTALSYQPVVEVEDSNGNPVTTDLSPVLLQISALSGSGSISGCTGLENKGYVAFSNCTISASGTYNIYATDISLPAVTGATQCPTTTNWQNNCQNSNYLPIALNGQGYSLVFKGTVAAGVSGAIMTGQPVVDVVYSANPSTVCTSCTGTVAITSSGGTLTTSGGNCTSIPLVNGVATATGCYFAGGYKLVANGNYQATEYVLVATATGDVTGESNAFGVTKYGGATQLSFYVQPIGTAAPTVPSSFLNQTVTIPNTTSPNSQAVVALEDSFGNVVVDQKNAPPASAVVSITLSISSPETNPGCASSFSNGYFFITGCKGSAYHNGVTLTATASATSGFIPPSVTSSAFNITGVAASIVFTVQPVAGASGSAFLTMPQITIEDALGKTVTAAGSTSISLTLTSGSGLLQLCTNLTPVAGVVLVQNCTFAGSESTTYTLTASITVNGVSPTPGISNGFSPNAPGPATKLFFTTQPAGGPAGAALSTQPVIQVQDTYGNLVTSSNPVITLTSVGGTLSNCANLAATGGVVSVTSCTFAGLVGTNYQLLATFGTLSSATSNNFQVSGPGVPNQLILNINQSGSSCTSGIQYQATCQASATIEDAYGNTETADLSPITFTLSGTGAVTSSGFTQALGVASETLTGSTIGSVSIYASDAVDALTSSTGTFSVVGKNQVITWTAPGAQTYGTNAVTLGAAGPTTLGSTGASFPGTGGSSIATSNTFNNPGSFSASLWFKTSTPGALAGATGNQSSVTTTGWDRNIWIDQAGHLVWSINDNNSLDEVASTAVVDNGAWHQVVATYGQAGEDLYLDGVLVGSAAGATAAQPYAFYWHLGFADLQYWPDNQSSSDYFQGSMAQAAIFGSQLTLAQVQSLYQATSAANESTAILALSPGGYWPLNDLGGSTVIADQSTHANTGYVEGTFSLGTASDTGATTVTFASSTQSVCTVSGTLVTTVAIGTCTITPTATAGGNYAVTTGTPTNITIGATNQTLTLTSPSSETWVSGGAGTFTIAVSDSAGTTVTYASATTGVCTVAGATVTMVTPGICNINPTAPAGGNYLMTPGNPFTITINPANQTITWTPPGTQTWQVGGNGTFLLGTASDSAATTVTFASSTTSVCTVSGTTVTMLTPGICTITPTAPAGGNYATTVGSSTNITINPANQTITWTPPGTQTWQVGGNGTFLLGTASDSAGTTVTFASSTTSVCTVSGTTVTMLTAGTCTITPTAPAGGNYATTLGSPANITINGLTQTITWTPPGTQTWQVGGNGTFSLGTASDTANTTVTFASSTTSVCTVSGTTVTMLTAGTCTITPTAPAGGGYNTTVGTASNITINHIGQTITFTSTAPTKTRVGAPTYTATATSSSGLAVTLSLDGTSAGCTLNTGTGVVTFTAAGTCKIDASQAGNVDYNAATQVQQAIPVVNMGFLSLATNSDVTNGTNNVATTAITTTAGNKVLILLSFTASATGNACATPVGTAFNTYTAITGTYNFFTTAAPYDYICAYSAVATGGTASTVSETFSGTAANMLTSTIQVMAITGDTSAVITNWATNKGSSAAPVFNLAAAPGTTSLEMLFGAVKYAVGTGPPTWSTTVPTGFTQLSTQSAVGSPSLIGEVYTGSAVLSATGSLAVTDPWGTIGLEIQP